MDILNWDDESAGTMDALPLEVMAIIFSMVFCNNNSNDLSRFVCKKFYYVSFKAVASLIEKDNGIMTLDRNNLWVLKRYKLSQDTITHMLHNSEIHTIDMYNKVISWEDVIKSIKALRTKRQLMVPSFIIPRTVKYLVFSNSISHQTLSSFFANPCDHIIGLYMKHPRMMSRFDFYDVRVLFPSLQIFNAFHVFDDILYGDCIPYSAPYVRLYDVTRLYLQSFIIRNVVILDVCFSSDFEHNELASVRDVLNNSKSIKAFTMSFYHASRTRYVNTRLDFEPFKRIARNHHMLQVLKVGKHIWLRSTDDVTVDQEVERLKDEILWIEIDNNIADKLYDRCIH